MRGAVDASSVAAAALAVAVDESREAALRELLLDRERPATQAEDLRSFVAERLAVEVGDSDAEEEEEEESDGEVIVCVLCRRSRSGWRQLFTMAAGGRWAGLAPGARVVCSDCRTEALGPVE